MEGAFHENPGRAADRLANQVLGSGIAEKERRGVEAEQMAAPLEITERREIRGEESPSSTGQGGP